MLGDCLLVPGIDDRAQRGFLVLRSGSSPYHSLADTAHLAYAESVTARRKSEQLVASFGNKTELKNAVRKAPLLMTITSDDVERSGLCQWGTEAFVRRFGLLGVAKRVGLPCALARIAGSYGQRIIAARLLRDKQVQDDLPQTEQSRSIQNGDAAA